MPASSIYSIGHSNLAVKDFLALLQAAEIEAIADVRSAPWSKFNPQFNKDALKARLQSSGIAYSFLGEELGGRPAEAQYFCDGTADYRKMAAAPKFSLGLDRVRTGASKFRLALMCSEHNPSDCHRCLLEHQALNVQRSLLV